jgi:Anti-sigma factor NepR
MSKTDEHRPATLPSVLKTDRTVSPAIQVILGEQLRAMYGKPEIEPLPDRLLDLLKQLEEPRWDDGK